MISFEETSAAQSILVILPDDSPCILCMRGSNNYCIGREGRQVSGQYGVSLLDGSGAFPSEAA